MRKTIIASAVATALVVFFWAGFNYLVTSKVELRQSQDASAISDANAGISKEAKQQGEAATVRADVKKSAIETKAKATKEKLRENFTSDDDEPLPDYVVVELCNTYHYSDCVRTPADKPTPGNKG